jgi:hypothetical protein
LTLDFIDTEEDFPIYHFCFRVSQPEFDTILVTNQGRRIKYGARCRALGHEDRHAIRWQRHLLNEPDGHYWEMLTVSYARQPSR